MSRIQQYKDELETKTLQMQFFCLDPQWVIYKDICNYPKLQIEQSAIHTVWKIAALAVNGVRWRSERGVDIDGNELDSCPPELTRTSIKNAVVGFIKLHSQILMRWKRNPKTVDLDRIWAMFFATGRYRYLELGFTAAVSNDAGQAKLADDAMTTYEAIRNAYADKIYKLEHEHPYWNKHRLIESVYDCLSALETLDTEIQLRSDRLNSAGFDPKKHTVDDLEDLIEDTFTYQGQQNNSDDVADDVADELQETLDKLSEKYGIKRSTKQYNPELEVASALFDKLLARNKK